MEIDQRIPRCCSARCCSALGADGMRRTPVPRSIPGVDSPGLGREGASCRSGEVGFLFSSIALGSIMGALILAPRRSARKGYLHLMGILIWVGALARLAASSLFLLSVAALFLLGIGQSFAATTSITLLQSRVPEQMRGRVMSLSTLLVMGIRPLGISPLISAIGASSTLFLSSAIVGVYAVAVALVRPSIRSA